MLGATKEFRRRLLAWYDRNRRDLPWRIKQDESEFPHPYHVLVSEIMLQQTQVATVIPYFHRFLAAFPTIEALARAPEQRVLRLWQGLGYYWRARNLHTAAKTVVNQHQSQIPSQVKDLINLPGVGRYTAGAIASIAFGQVAPVLDGNVTRVLCRLDAIETDPRHSGAAQQLWSRAAELVPHRRPGDFNSALMELGATVCTLRNPQCLLCPVKSNCVAADRGIQHRLPIARAAKPLPLIRRYTYCIRHKNHWLLEQRPPHGRWPSMWQFITLESPTTRPVSLRLINLQSLITLRRTLTHRRYEFDVFHAMIANRNGRMPKNTKWLTLDQIENYPLPVPHLKVLDVLTNISGNDFRPRRVLA